MATIRSQMVLNDGMTSVLRKISGALTTTLDAFEQMQRASGQSINSAQFAAARSQLVGANTELDKMADNFQKAGSKADGLMGKISGIAAGIASIATVQKLVTLSDDVTSAQARLNLLVTDGGSVDELEAKIMASANRSRSAYLDTASAVAKLGLNAGNAFDHDMDQVIAFMEQVNKQFVIGGATAQEQSNAMVQLTQAMAAGALRGEELNSILDSAPGIARAIEQYMGVAEGSIKEYAAEGKVTAQVVKNALFSVADETNAKFESMPMTWAQVWTMMSNIALQALEPVLTFINWLANNIEIIGPLVLGVAAALAVYLTRIATTPTGSPRIWAKSGYSPPPASRFTPAAVTPAVTSTPALRSSTSIIPIPPRLQRSTFVPPSRPCTCWPSRASGIRKTSLTCSSPCLTRQLSRSSTASSLRTS